MPPWLLVFFALILFLAGDSDAGGVCDTLVGKPYPKNENMPVLLVVTPGWTLLHVWFANAAAQF